jgi:hypothetical protein
LEEKVSRPRRLEVAVINITMHPNSLQSYIELFRMTAKLENFVKYRDNEQLAIRNVSILESPLNKLPEIKGYFCRGIDLRETSWGSFSTAEEVPPEEAPQIPSDLRANFKYVPFIFLPDKHRLFFCARDGNQTFNPSYTADALKTLFNHPQLHSKFEEVAVILQTERDAAERMIELPSIQKLKIVVVLPNGDSFSEDDIVEIKERLKIQNVRKQSVEMTSANKEGIKPDSKTKAAAMLSSSYGNFSLEWEDGGKKRYEKTTDHPIISAEEYNPDRELLTDRLRAIAQKILKRVTTSKN